MKSVFSKQIIKDKRHQRGINKLLGSRRKSLVLDRRRQQERLMNFHHAQTNTRQERGGGFMDNDKMFNQEVVSPLSLLHRQVASRFRLITKIKEKCCALIKESIIYDSKVFITF
jgi:hypothetical protein